MTYVNLSLLKQAFLSQIAVFKQAVFFGEPFERYFFWKAKLLSVAYVFLFF